MINGLLNEIRIRCGEMTHEWARVSLNAEKIILECLHHSCLALRQPHRRDILTSCHDVYQLLS